jgi:hypothetical protein
MTSAEDVKPLAVDVSASVLYNHSSGPTARNGNYSVERDVPWRRAHLPMIAVAQDVTTCRFAIAPSVTLCATAISGQFPSRFRPTTRLVSDLLRPWCRTNIWQILMIQKVLESSVSLGTGNTIRWNAE